MTGHLVLTTLHAQTASASLQRLLDIGVDRSIIASSVNAFVAQRLVRKLCPECREPYAADGDELQDLGVPDGISQITLHRAVGCRECGDIGYKGRVAVFEVLTVTDAIATMIGASSREVEAMAVAQGMLTLREDGVRLSVAGVTSIDEVRRVVGTLGTLSRDAPLSHCSCVTPPRLRDVLRSMRALAVCVLVLFAAGLAAAVEPARACSCAQPDPRSALADADGAFVGRLLARRQLDDRAVLTFSVERAVKGSLGSMVEVETARDSAGCGLELPVGTRTGLVLERREGAWHGHLCAQFAPADLLAAAKPLPAPNGSGPVALLRRRPLRACPVARTRRARPHARVRQRHRNHRGALRLPGSAARGRAFLLRLGRERDRDPGSAHPPGRCERQHLSVPPLDVPAGLRCLDRAATEVSLLSWAFRRATGTVPASCS